MAGLSNIGKIQASLATVTQETTLALVNFNFDWSIFKVEAPAEYKSVGNALTTTRRNQAEAGAAHRTARKLGSLFEDIIPDTPELIRAYGIRATEIVKFHQDIADKKKRTASDYGAFTEYVGVDGTSIWAAATSSPAAIAVHLLACVLARAFPAAEAVAIWEQIVEERKREVSRFDDNGSIPLKNLQGLMASSWEIPRSDLASWDSSARAWIRSADSAKEYNCHQIRLIIDNLDLPVHTSVDVYKSVIETWTTCMQLINNLICGNGQAVHNGALLVAFRAWHIFPDLMILKDDQLVRQGDPLVKPGGLVTIGLERTFKDENRVGVNWTLSLTHYRYYADREIREGILNSTKDRITVEDMWMFLVGFVMAFFNLNIADLDYVCALIERLYSIILESVENTRLLRHLRRTWLNRISEACIRYNNAQEDQAYLRKLASLGYKSFKKSFPGIPVSIELKSDDVFTMVDPNFHLQLLNKLFWKRINSGRTYMIVKYKFTEKEESLDDFHVVNQTFEDWDQFEISSVMIEPESDDAHHRFVTSMNRIDIAPDETGSETCFYAYFYPSDPMESLIVYGKLLPIHIALLMGLIDGLDPEKIKVLSDSQSFMIATSQRRPPDAVILFQGIKAESLQSPTQNLVWERWKPFSSWENSSTSNISRHDFDFLLESGKVNAPFVWAAILNAFPGWDTCLGSRKSRRRPSGFLQRIASVSALYDSFEEPLIDLSALSSCFSAMECDMAEVYWPSSVPWPPSLALMFEVIKPFIGEPFTGYQAFQYIYCLETKGVWLGEQMPGQVMAISSENSLFIAAPFLSDPSESSWGEHRLQRVIRLPGNIGKPGVVIIVPTETSRMPQKEDTLVEDASFDGQLLDCYRNTTLHLTLTGYELPLQETKQIGLRHQMTWIIGAATSVYESGNWIGDINPLNLEIYYTTNQLLHRSDAESCTYCEGSQAHAYKDMKNVLKNSGSLTSIDSWDEYFNRPWNATIFRSKGNWAARLAAVCFGVETNTLTLLLNPATCQCEINRIFARRTYEKLSNGHVARQKRAPKPKWIYRVEEPEEVVGRGGKTKFWSDSEDSPSVADDHLVNRHPVIVL